jgi:hypothetical protein
MKKITSFIFISLFASLLAFSTEYSVKSITGKVKYEASPDNWQIITEGQTLTDGTVINTGLNSLLVLSSDSGEIKIKAMQQGTIQELCSEGVKVGGLKKSKKINTNTLAHTSTREKIGVSTAASRASEAKNDLDWDD